MRACELRGVKTYPTSSAEIQKGVEVCWKFVRMLEIFSSYERFLVENIEKSHLKSFPS